MTATYTTRSSRQPIILAAILGLHFGLFVLISSGLVPRMLDAVDRPPPPITVVLKEEEPTVVVAPDRPVQPDPYFMGVVEPDLIIPEFPEPDSSPPTRTGESAPPVSNGPAVSSGVERTPPALRTRDRRLAALIDACYPAASRRLGEEGRTIARITIGVDGKARAWRVAETSGFARLDEAIGCVIGPLDFVAGRQDGRAVEAEALLPIVFRLD